MASAAEATCDTHLNHGRLLTDQSFFIIYHLWCLEKCLSSDILILIVIT